MTVLGTLEGFALYVVACAAWNWRHIRGYWRTTRARRQVNRRDQREIARYRAARNTTSPIDFWSHP